MNYKELIMNVLKKNRGYISTRELENLNINRFYIYSLEKEGIVERIKRGIYKDKNYGAQNELTEVAMLIPSGVFCLNTALEFYGLTTSIPLEYNIAIPNKSKVIVPDYPPVKLYYFTDNYYSIGIKKINIDGFEIKIYDIEKSICDMVRYKSKIGLDIIIEVVKQYMRRDDKDLNKLIEYAKKTKAFDTLKNYLEVLS